MTDYEKLLEEAEQSVVMPPPREPGRCDGDVSCRECDRDGDARCGLEYGHEGDCLPFADVYERGLRDMIGKLAAALREVMAERDSALRVHNEAEQTLDMERTVRAEAERDLVSARAALHERGSAPLAEHEDMGRWTRLPVWAQQELEQWRRNEAHQRGLADAALADVEAMRLRLQLETAALEQVCSDLESAQTVRRLVADVEAMRAVVEAGRVNHGAVYEGRWTRVHEDDCDECNAIDALDARGKERG